MDNVNKRLLTLKEFCEYLSIGQTKARELVKGENGFAIKLGGKWYIDKSKLDHWIDSNLI